MISLRRRKGAKGLGDVDVFALKQNQKSKSSLPQIFTD